MEVYRKSIIFLHQNPELRNWLLLFNAFPLAAFSSIVLVAAVINFGVAVIFQITLVVLSLIWLIPCVLFSSVTAFFAFQMYTRFSDYIDRRKQPKGITKIEEFGLPTPPASPVFGKKDKVL